MKLQLLDHLTGQGDRSCANYFINIEPDGNAKVTGIDNDQCFGPFLHDPNGIKEVPGDPHRWGFRGTSMPPVVDTEMATLIRGLTSIDLYMMLWNKLSEPEIQANSRLMAVKHHVDALARVGWVISPQDWGQDSVQHRLRVDNCYIERDRNFAISRDLSAPLVAHW
jgi:hypothetical protein